MSTEQPSEPQTWHYGLVARWWAEFKLDGPEIEFLRPYVEVVQPALDVACDTGRVLIPLLQAGLDVDGSDLSPDMLALCRERAEREGLAPNLYAQATHELDIPRSYRTIYMCGSFGLGGNGDHDREALRRQLDYLEPGGLLVLDHEMSYSEPQGGAIGPGRVVKPCRRSSRSGVAGWGRTARSIGSVRAWSTSIRSRSGSRWRCRPRCDAATRSSRTRRTCWP